MHLFVVCCMAKSCENRVVLWKPGSHTSELHSVASKAESGTAVSVLHQFDFANCDIWFMRFAMDHAQKVGIRVFMLVMMMIIIILLYYARFLMQIRSFTT